ncbi:MAG: type II toxin-antitoxin system CcdA family antitoxin [Rhodospirillales bacterium]|nr:type II toxin-antitoxin system CcdA family antitoxin [Rhodospirillales bacterium]
MMRPKRATSAGVRRTKWWRQNHAAFATYDKYVEKHGMFSDGVRLF